MLEPYSADVIESIKSLYRKIDNFYDDIIELARYSYPWQQTKPLIIDFYTAHYAKRYVVPDVGVFYAVEIMLLLGLNDLIRDVFNRTTFILRNHQGAVFACSAWCNKTEIFKLYFKSNVFNFQNSANLALYYAIQNNNIEIMNIIHDSKVRVYTLSAELSESLDIAHTRGYFEAIKLMLSKFNAVMAIGGKAIEGAAIEGNVNFFKDLCHVREPYCKELLSQRIDLSEQHTRYKTALTPITTAAIRGSWNVVRFLFDLGVPLRTEVCRRMRDYYGETVLHTIYNCHLPSDLKDQKPLIADIYNNLRDSLPRHEQIFFAQHFAIEDFMHILKI